MMTRRDGVQQKMLCVTLESLMPQEHFLRRLDSLMDFSFIYQRVESLYSHRGRPSIDPVVVVKMLLLGYLYGIDSERRLEQEVRVNIAYRWFLGIDLDEPVPDHSTFSQLRRRKFNGAALFEELFDEVVRKCIEYGLIDGKLLLTDSTHVRANARNDVLERVAVEAEPSAYLQRLNEQAVKDGVYPKHRKEKKKGYKELVKSPADPDAGFMKRTGKPLGFYYLSHQTCDARHGLITDVHTTPGNVLDSTVHSERIKRQIAVFGFKPEAVCADSAYDSSEIHKDMLDMGIRTYIPKRNLPKPASGVFSEADFIYDRESDTLTCPNACRLIFSNYRDRLGQKRYKASAGECSACPLRSRCISRDAKYRVVERAYFKWASEEQHMRNDGTPGYYEALRLRKIYCEGNFSHQKAEHNLRRLRKRGLGKAHEHCLLSATALNLKRMVKLLTTRKHPGVSLRKTLSAIGRSSMLYPMALLSTGPRRRTLCEEALPKGALLYMAMYVRPFSSLRSGQGRGPCAAVRLTQFQGGMVIAKTKEQLQRECAELEQRIRQHQNRLQRLEQRTKHIAKGERQKRAHRLITRGAAVESVAPAVCGMTEHEFYELVERIFALPEVQALLPKGGE